LLCAGELEAAIPPAREALDQQPSFVICGMHLANALGAAGHTAEAHSAVERCARSNPRFSPSYYRSLMGVLSDQPGVVEVRTSGLEHAGILNGAPTPDESLSESS
jgi:predicted Zn-dependent protease